MSPEEALDEINQQIEDMNTAKMAALQNKKGLGDYDLATATQAARKDREFNESQQLPLTPNINPIQEQSIPVDPNVPIEQTIA